MSYFNTKDETPACRQLQRSDMIYSGNEKMIHIDIEYKWVRSKTDKGRKDTKDKEATLI